MRRLDVVVIGAGQAGLAVGYYSAAAGSRTCCSTRHRRRAAPGRAPGREGLWAYYYVKPEALDELAGWLS